MMTMRRLHYLSIISAIITPIIVFYTIYVDVETPILIMSGHSMIPTLFPYDIVFIYREDINNIKEGDVIAFKSPYVRNDNNSILQLILNKNSNMVVHRVVEVKKDESNVISFVTRGDANANVDKDVVTASNYVGKAYLVISPERLKNNFSNPFMVLIISMIIGMGFIIYKYF